MSDGHPVEVVAFVWKGWWLWAGRIEYRQLATLDRPFDSFWIEWAKGDSSGIYAPLDRARGRDRLIEKLRAHAATLGRVHTFAVKDRRDGVTRIRS